MNLDEQLGPLNLRPVNSESTPTTIYLIPSLPFHQLYHHGCPGSLQYFDCGSAYLCRYACVVLLISTLRVPFLYMYVMPL